MACLIAALVQPAAHARCTTVDGDVVLGGSAVLKIDIAGPAPCTEYDRLIVGGMLQIAPGATLRLVLTPPFTPSPGDRFPVLAWDVLSGSFDTFDTTAAPLPAGSTWDFSRLDTDGEVFVLGPAAPAEQVPLPRPFVALLAILMLALERRLSAARSQGTGPDSA